MFKKTLNSSLVRCLFTAASQGLKGMFDELDVLEFYRFDTLPSPLVPAKFYQFAEKFVPRSQFWVERPTILIYRLKGEKEWQWDAKKPWAFIVMNEEERELIEDMEHMKGAELMIAAEIDSADVHRLLSEGLAEKVEFE